MRKPFTQEEFKSIYSQVPRLTVDLVVRMNSGIILTLRSLTSWKNQWHLPGGTILYKETIEEAVYSVAQRELGVEVNILKKLGNIEYSSEEKERGYGWTISIVVLCDSLPGSIKINNEASQVKIFNSLPENLIGEQKDFLNTHWKEILP